MRLILAFLFVTLTAASRITYIPTSNRIFVLKSPAAVDRSPRQYQEQDSRGFYSYGYSGDTAAKAEYSTLDGSSKGFYSYVDANGKVQTVKYVAGKKQGFKASATNLPRAPIDSRRAPVPVKDTPEVQRAKQAHFEAYREAELRAALASAAQAQAQANKPIGEPSREEQERAREAIIEAAILQDAKQQILAMMAEQQQQQQQQLQQQQQQQLQQQQLQQQEQLQQQQLQQQQQQQQQAQAQDDEEQNRNNNDNDVNDEMRDSDEDDEADLCQEDIEAQRAIRLQQLQQQRQEQLELQQQQQQQQQQQLQLQQQNQQQERLQQQKQIIVPEPIGATKTITDSNELAILENLRTIYSLEDDKSSSVLKLGNFNLGPNQQPTLDIIQTKTSKNPLTPLTTIDSVRVPVNSYYTLLGPSGQYSVVTPTVLATVPGDQASKLGQQLPISLSSSFVSQRIKSKTT